MKISGKKSFILILVASILLFFLSYLIGNAIFQNKSYNFMVKYTSNDNIASDDVILVVIDDKSLTELGRWPWKRDRTIQIFDYLEYYTDAKVIAYDAVVMAPDFENPESDRYFFNNVGKYNKLIAGVGFMSENFGDNINEAEYNALLTEKNNIKVIDKRRKKQNIKRNNIISFQSFYQLFRLFRLCSLRLCQHLSLPLIVPVFYRASKLLSPQEIIAQVPPDQGGKTPKPPRRSGRLPPQIQISRPDPGDPVHKEPIDPVLKTLCHPAPPLFFPYSI